MALQLDPGFQKAYGKAGKACKKLREFQEASQYFQKAFELTQDPQMQREMEDTTLLAKYSDQLEEHIRKQEYKDALRKINNILEQSDANCYLIEKKVFLLCV